MAKTYLAKKDHTHTAADVGAAAASHKHAASDINSGTLSSDRLPTVPIAKGGTGATTAAAALTNLGAVAKSGDTMTGDLRLDSGKIFFDYGKIVSNDYDINLAAGLLENNEAYTRFFVSNPKKTDLSGLVRFSTVYDNVETIYKIYGEHNKPKVEDVDGAVSKDKLDLKDTLQYMIVNPWQPNHLEIIARAVDGSEYQLMIRDDGIHYFRRVNEELIENWTIAKKDEVLPLDGSVAMSDNLKFSIGKGLRSIGSSIYDLILNGDNNLPEVLCIWENGGNRCRIFGEHNKPSGTYSGNGGSQTIDTGGIGDVILVQLTGSGGGFAIVTKSGAIGKLNSNNSVFALADTEAKFIGGVLTLNSSNYALNRSGYGYNWQVL